MKIAILIGVDYYDSLSNLPSCKADLSLMEKVIRSSEQYAEIYIISNNCTGDTVKSKITGFLSDLHGKEIDEVFFYFSGHGDFYDDQFYYILSDFDSRKRKQTSLENSEVDDWLRSLNPGLAIKVVDACYSGVTYIKNDNAVKEHLEKFKAGFKNCYFMFSSRLDQTSYQDIHLSYFTHSFLSALCKSPSKKIRYKDIIDYVSDDFEQRGSQTPIFVTQGTYTEVFCCVTSEMIKVLESVCGETESPRDQKTSVPEIELKTLEDIVNHDAVRYCSAEEVEEMLAKLKEYAQQFAYSSEIDSIFDVKYDFGSHDEDEKLPKEAVIGRWLAKSGTDYFAEPTDEEEAYEREVPDYFSTYAILRGGYRTVTRYRTIIVGFRNTANLSYNLLRINAEPKYPNVMPFNCTVVTIFSKSRLRFFYFYTQYKEKNWRDRELIPDIKWNSSEYELKDEIGVLDGIDKIQKTFASFIMTNLEDRFGHLRT